MAKTQETTDNSDDDFNIDGLSLEQLTSKDLGAQIKQLQVLKRQVEEEERASKPAPRRGRGVMSTAKKILWFEPDIDIADLHKRVVDQCGPCSLTVIQTVRSDFRNTIEVLRELGKLKEEPGQSKPPPQAQDDENKDEASNAESESANEVVDVHEDSPRKRK
jgi:hypothetical protein